MAHVTGRKQRYGFLSTNKAVIGEPRNSIQQVLLCNLKSDGEEFASVTFHRVLIFCRGRRLNLASKFELADAWELEDEYAALWRRLCYF